MDGLKKSLTGWMKVTEARVCDLRTLASSIHSDWEELKGGMKEGMEERKLIEQTDVEIVGILTEIEKNVCSFAGIIESWCVVKKDVTIELDELVEEVLREKEVVCRSRKEHAMKRKLLERGSNIDDLRDVEATKVVDGLGALVDLLGDDSMAQLLLVSRVEKRLAEYLELDERYRTGEVETHVMMVRVESLMVGTKSDQVDGALLKYVFDEGRNAREVVIATETLSLRREEILPLAMNRLATKKVVDIFVEILTVEEREVRGNRARFWWIPTYITRPLEDENYVLNKRSSWSKWMGDLEEVCKIYVPVMLRGTWCIAIIRIEDSIVEVACSGNNIVVQECIGVVHDVLEALDVVLQDDILEVKPIGWRFSEFEVYKGHLDMEIDSSGMFVMKAMQSAVDEGLLHNQGAVEDELLFVALKILKSEFNKARLDIVSQAISVARGIVGEM